MPEKPEKKPDPELQNDVFVKEVRRLLFGVKYIEEKPTVKTAAMGPISKDEGAGTFYTFTFEERQAVVEWRAKEGFYVTPKRERQFGVDAESVVMNPYIAAVKVVKLIGGGETVGLLE
jgi:hypothetical protein